MVFIVWVRSWESWKLSKRCLYLKFCLLSVWLRPCITLIQWVKLRNLTVNCVSCEYLTRLTRQCLTCKSLQAHIHIVKVWFPHKQHRQWLLIGHHYEVLSPEANTQQSCNFATAREVSTLFTRDNFVRAQNTLNIFSFAKLWFTLLSYGLLCYLNLIVRPCPLGPLV